MFQLHTVANSFFKKNVSTKIEIIVDAFNNLNFSFQVNGKCLKGLFHEEVVRTLKELPVEVCLVCARKVTGPSPLRGTIVDNVDPGRSEQAFASRVRNYLF